jgi:peptidyl-prolyl cis-trans isomerase C
MPRKSLLLVALLALAALAGCKSKAAPTRAGALQAQDASSPVIVEINGSPEYRAAFERFVKSRLSDLYKEQNPADNDQLRSALFDEFVLRQLIVREAEQRQITASDDEISKAVAEQHQQTSADGGAQNQAALAGAERAVEIAHYLTTIKYYRSEVLKDVKVTPAEVEAFFKQNPARYPQEERFCAREIRVASEEEAERLRKQALDKPSDFATLAREHSNAPTAGNGGLMPCLAANVLPKVLEDAIAPLKEGKVSEVVKSNHGYHIFRLEKRVEPQTFEKVSKQVEEDLISSNNQKLIDAYNGRALANARIKVYYDRLGFSYNGSLKQRSGGS